MMRTLLWNQFSWPSTIMRHSETGHKWIASRDNKNGVILQYKNSESLWITPEYLQTYSGVYITPFIIVNWLYDYVHVLLFDLMPTTNRLLACHQRQDKHLARIQFQSNAYFNPIQYCTCIEWGSPLWYLNSESWESNWLQIPRRLLSSSTPPRIADKKWKQTNVG
jgi:hypothetical protein